MMFKLIAVLGALASSTNAFSVNPAVRANSLSSQSILHDVLEPTANLLSYRGGAVNQKDTSLKATTSPSSSDNTELDTGAIAKYGAALVTQLTLISGLFCGIDYALETTGLSLPTPVTWLMFYFLSLKSRTFNPLNNERPNRGKAVEGEKSAGFQDRVMPSWTPPGVVFPIMWLLIIGPLRATSSTLVVQALGGTYFSLPIMSLMLHLTCGDIWNTINNAEGRYGTSVLGISTVYVSALHAAYRYYQVDVLPGELLGATAIWLTIASTLIFETWRLNVDANGEKQSLLPVKVVGEESVTRFAWGSSDKKE